jgi:hypothetical protein
MGSGAWPQKIFVECLHADDTYISCNVSTVMVKFAVGTGLDRLVPKLKLQKLNFWLNLDKKVARQMPMFAVPLLKLARHLPCHVQWWRRL